MQNPITGALPELSAEEILEAAGGRELVRVLDLGPSPIPRQGDDYIFPSARGKRAGALSMEVQRELGPEDIGDVVEAKSGRDVGGLRPLAQMRHSHHLIARLLAEGRKAVEVSYITGRTQSWISSLQRDPAFADLVASYKEQVTEAYVNVHERLAALGIDTIDELHQRLLENPDEFTKKELLALGEFALDRSIAPPKAGADNRGGTNGAPAVQLNVTFVKSSHSEDYSDGVVIDAEPL